MNAAAWTGALGAPEVVADGLDQDCDGKDACYVDADRDGHGTPATVATADADCTDPGESLLTDDCYDGDLATYPGAVEIVGDGIDQDCDRGDLCGLDRDGDHVAGTETVASVDLDCADAREATAKGDCNDLEPSVHPGAVDVPADGVDRDCSGDFACFADTDGDGFGDATVASTNAMCDGTGEAAVGGDCDDGSAAAHPRAEEVPGDGVDQDCDGHDACYADGDDDGYGADVIVSDGLDCDEPGKAAAGGDCDDASPGVHPEATEQVADGVDQDCDGKETCYGDADHDGYGATVEVASTDLACGSPGAAPVATDCDDTSAFAHPGAIEVAGDSIDQDCDGEDACHADADGDGFGGAAPGPCDGGSPLGTDCDDADLSVFPGADEICDGQDNDCDGVIDEGWPGSPDCEKAPGVSLVGCGCGSALPPSLWPLGLVVLATQRRRGSRRADGRGPR